MTKNIGFGIEAPKNECKDKKCPFHGDLKVRGRSFEGTVISAKFAVSPTIEWKRMNFVQKYERYERARTRMKAHNPKCIDAAVGDRVLIMECRPISKTKNFVIVKKL
jgi:small subunit ribosomal protein S17